MKKLTLLLMPVMPGFEAWAVNGFVEISEKGNEAQAQPKPIPSPVLKTSIQGFTLPAGEMVFVSYTYVGYVIRSLVNLTSDFSIRPLDRGGVLVSGTLSDTGVRCLDKVLKACSETEETVSQSK